jgi:transcriptional regulator with XRE-family HTH domain
VKHSEYKRIARQAPGFQEAMEELRLEFAFGDAVLNARIERGWSQAELARRSGTKQANISRIEAGLANPTLDLVYRLCWALEIDVRFSARSEQSPVLYADKPTRQVNFQSLNEASEDSYPQEPVALISPDN